MKTTSHINLPYWAEYVTVIYELYCSTMDISVGIYKHIVPKTVSAYRYFGLQYGTQCFCGNSFGRYGKSPNQGDCNKPCLANRNEICGGTWRNSVYDLQPPGECVLGV